MAPMRGSLKGNVSMCPLWSPNYTFNCVLDKGASSRRAAVEVRQSDSQTADRIRRFAVNASPDGDRDRGRGRDRGKRAGGPGGLDLDLGLDGPPAGPQFSILKSQFFLYNGVSISTSFL